jgi:colanic acid/amylovoran biosynthesis glycosyltransferase
MRTLHVFTNFLPQTKNWLYHLLSNLPDCDITVAAQEYCKSNFYLAEPTQYIQFPLNEISAIESKSFNRAVRALRDFAFPRMIAAQCGQIDLIHAHFANAGWHYLPLARRLRVPYVVSLYGYDYEQLPASHPKWERRLRTLFSVADMFVCEGSHGARILADRGCPPEKIRVAHLGVRVDRIPFVRRAKVPGALKLVQVATITEKKGYNFTVRAFLRALPACPNMTLDLVGDYHSEDGRKIFLEIHEIIKGNGVEEKVRFVPGIAYSRLHSFLSNYHVFVHPSVYAKNRDCEGGAPVVLLDAQGTGMPVISTIHCDIPSEVLHGVSGLLCQERDIEGLAESMAYFYHSDQSAFDRFSASAREHVQERFDIVRNASKLRALYDEVAGKHQDNGAPPES